MERGRILMIWTFLFFAIIESSSACVQLRRLLLSETTVMTVRPLCKVPNVTGVKSCAQLCLRETNCAAARYRSATKQCDLLTARLDGLEGAAALAEVSGDVEVWAIVGRGLGECPPSFTAFWRSSRYRLVTERATWHDADRWCREQGAKLAELTSLEELAFVLSIIKESSEKPSIFVGGLQKPGAGEPAEGWYWSRSGLSVAAVLWGGSEPNHLDNAENHLSIQSGILNDCVGSIKSTFICECSSITV